MWGSSITFQDYPLEQVISTMSGLGFVRVEMWQQHLQRCRTPQLRQLFVQYAASMGISMGGLNVVGEAYFQPFGSEEEWQGTLKGLCNDVDYALSLGTKDVLIWEGVRPPGMDDEACYDLLLPKLIRLFRDAIAYAAPKGVRFLVEPHPFTVGMSDKFLIALCNALPPESFGVTFDFCHYGVGRPRDYVAAVGALGGCIRHIHFSDSDMQSSELHFGAGEGRMDLHGLLNAFREIRFQGTLTVDLYGHPTPIQAANQTAAQVRKACEFLGIAQ
jgi:sugar phosphate isomerase/epimerase